MAALLALCGDAGTDFIDTGRDNALEIILNAVAKRVRSAFGRRLGPGRGAGCDCKRRHGRNQDRVK